MNLYTVEVVSENGMLYGYTVLAHNDEQAVNLAKRHHNRETSQPGFRAVTGSVKSKRRLRPGVVHW